MFELMIKVYFWFDYTEYLKIALLYLDYTYRKIELINQPFIFGLYSAKKEVILEFFDKKVINYFLSVKLRSRINIYLYIKLIDIHK